MISDELCWVSVMWKWCRFCFCLWVLTLCCAGLVCWHFIECNCVHLQHDITAQSCCNMSDHEEVRKLPFHWWISDLSERNQNLPSFSASCMQKVISKMHLPVIMYILYYIKNQDSLVGILTRLQTGWSCAHILAVARDFSGCVVCTLLMLMLRIQVVRVVILGCIIIGLQHFEGNLPNAISVSQGV